MKKYIKFLAFPSLAFAMMACSNNYEQQWFEYEGSENPEHYSYHNPVWEPSLAGGTVFKAASNFVGISQETQWAVGLDYACPAIQSPDLMKWSSNQQAFSYPVTSTNEETGETTVTPGSYPEWLKGKITNVSADFASTVAGANYWMIYGSETDNAFGAASASGGPGPYTDLGCFLTAEDLGVSSLRYPHLSVIIRVNYYLGYTTENGSYIQKINIRRGAVPTMTGSAVKVSGDNFKDVCLFRSNDGMYYLFGTVQNGNSTEIRYGRSENATGPFYDRNGNELTDGVSNGELLVESGTSYINPCNAMRMFFCDVNGYYYIAYNATRIGTELMPSGFARQPLFLNPVEMNEEGWFTSVVAPEEGWTTPRYE